MDFILTPINGLVMEGPCLFGLPEVFAVLHTPISKSHLLGGQGGDGWGGQGFQGQGLGGWAGQTQGGGDGRQPKRGTDGAARVEMLTDGAASVPAATHPQIRGTMVYRPSCTILRRSSSPALVDCLRPSARSGSV